MLEKTLESPLDCKEIQPVHPKGNQSWMFIGRTDAEAETAILWPPDMKSWLIWKNPNAGKDWRKAGGERDDRGWGGWMASPTQWTWVWVISGSWWWSGRPGILQSMGSQIVGHDWVTELNWTEDPTILLLGIYPEKTIFQKDTCTPIFIAALFTQAKTWKQPKYWSVDEWIKNMWYICTMEYYSVKEKDAIMPFTATWMNLEIIMLSEVC